MRKAFQEARGGGKSGDHRSLTPTSWIGEPLGMTFSDGSEKGYRAVVYFRGETEQGIQVRLVESKAKLTSLDQKREPIKEKNLWCSICSSIQEVY